MGCLINLFNRTLLIALNVGVVVVGIAVIALGSDILADNHLHLDLLQEGLLVLPSILVGVGAVVVVVGILGCLGSFCKCKWMLHLYVGIVVILFIAGMVLGIMILIRHSDVKTEMADSLSENFAKYMTDPDMKQNIDDAQQDMECCGVDNYTYWFNVIPGGNSVAKGCCKDMTEFGCNINIKGLDQVQIERRIYTTGCIEAYDDVIAEGLAMGILAIILVCIQLASITCACGVIKKGD